MKKAFAILLTVCIAFAAFAMAATADFESVLDGTTYDVFSPKEIELTYQGTEVKAVPQGGSTLDALGDGDLVRDASGFSTAGVVLVQNCFIPDSATANGGKASQDAEEIPSFSFVMTFPEEVTFDTAYVALYHEIAVCIANPADNSVLVEYSSDKRAWSPVGEGIFYFNSQVGDYTGAGDQGIDECAIALGEDVTAKYVRFTFSFMEVPEGGYWAWYTNVYEWCGFTELGVAKYKSGKQQNVVDKSQAQAEPTAVEGNWIGDDGEQVTIWCFSNDQGNRTVGIVRYDSEEYSEKGLEAEIQEITLATYSVLADQLTITYENGEYDVFQAVVDEDGDLILGFGTDSVVCSPYTEPEESSEEPVSEDPVSEEPVSEDAPEEASSEAVSSAAASSEASSAENSKAVSSAAEDGGFPIWGIVLIAVAAAVIIAVIVILIVRKRKTNA